MKSQTFVLSTKKAKVQFKAEIFLYNDFDSFKSDMDKSGFILNDHNQVCYPDGDVLGYFIINQFGCITFIFYM